MKRLFSVAFAIIILMVSVFNLPTFATSECEHEAPIVCWDSYYGCHEGLYMEGECSKCGEYIIESIENPMHNWQYDTTKEPDCTNDGYVRYKCLYCEKTNDFKIAALGHNGELVDTFIGPANYDEDYCYSITNSYNCSRCGEWYEEKEYVYEHTYRYDYDPEFGKCQGNYHCTVCYHIDEEKSKEARELYHNWVTEKSESCFESYERVYCTLCNTVKSQIFSFDNHDWEKTVITEPSCETGGRYIYNCSKCGSSYEDWEPQIHQKGQLLRTVAPSCNSVGYKVYACSLCGAEFNDDYGDEGQHTEPRLEYSEYVDYDCSKGIKHHYYCSDCGNNYDVIEETPGHNWQVEDVFPKYTCDSQEITNYTCSNDGCEANKQVVTKEATEHNWIETELSMGDCRYRKSKSCDVCGLTFESEEYQRCDYKTTVYRECGKIGYTYKECTNEYTNGHDIIVSFNNSHTFENKRIYDSTIKKYIYRDVCSSCSLHNGDLNEDGKVNVLDFVRIKKELANISNNNVFDHRDCTQDGLLNSLDLIYMINVLIDKR